MQSPTCLGRPRPDATVQVVHCYIVLTGPSQLTIPSRITDNGLRRGEHVYHNCKGCRCILLTSKSNDEDENGWAPCIPVVERALDAQLEVSVIPDLNMGRAGDITHCDWIRETSWVRAHIQLAALRQL